MRRKERPENMFARFLICSEMIHKIVPSMVMNLPWTFLLGETRVVAPTNNQGKN
jgi:hypothetical protein